MSVGHYATHPDVGEVKAEDICKRNEDVHFQWPAVATTQLRFVRRGGVKILQQLFVRGPESYYEDVPLEEEKNLG